MIYHIYLEILLRDFFNKMRKNIVNVLLENVQVGQKISDLKDYFEINKIKL